MLSYSQDFKYVRSTRFIQQKGIVTHQVSITGLHPLDRHDEGMIGQLTR
jgi:hypothetical protein